MCRAQTTGCARPCANLRKLTGAFLQLFARINNGPVRINHSHPKRILVRDAIRVSTIAHGAKSQRGGANSQRKQRIVNRFFSGLCHGWRERVALVVAEPPM